jgi:acetate kinase
MKILVLNAGSSSQKSRLYEINLTPAIKPPKPLWEANADWTREQNAAELTITANGQTVNETRPADSRSTVTGHMLRSLWSGETQVIDRPEDIAVVGHRVVHGGPDYSKSILITPEVKATIKRLAAFAPLHNPVNLEGIKAAEQLLANVPQVAVFDTAFHSHIPKEVAAYPGPYSWYEQGIRRYGFHGPSHQYCARRSAEILGRDLDSLRIINCHLGNGCSLAAIRHGYSIDTTMGFTPLEGLMMGSRSGTVDPSILIYLQRKDGDSADKLDQMLNKESGLKGISGVSSDLRQVKQAIDEGNKRATLALDMFIYRLRYFTGAMLASLGGVDVLTFTGGIGENSPQVRAGACQHLSFLNLKLDAAKNNASPADQEISTPDSAVRVLIVHTEEDWQIARECWEIMEKLGR